jgi:hypothetical protein
MTICHPSLNCTFLAHEISTNPALTVSRFVSVEHGQQLSVERHQRGSNEIGRSDQLLDYLHDGAHDLGVFRVERVLDRNNELRDDGIDAIAAVREEVLNALASERLVRMLSLGEAVKKERQVQTVIELVNVDCPRDLLAANEVLHLDGQVATVVVHAKRGRWLLQIVPIDSDCGWGETKIVVVEAIRKNIFLLLLTLSVEFGFRYECVPLQRLDRERRNDLKGLLKVESKFSSEAIYFTLFAQFAV